MLFVPAGANSFGAIQASQAARPVSANGTAVTPAIGSKGSWVGVLAALDDDTYGLLINFNSNTTSGACRNSVVDIGIGTPGSEIVIIPDLIAGNAQPYTVNGNGIWYYFPVAIPAGTRVAIRAQGTVTTAFRCNIQAFQAPPNPSMLKKASFVEPIGMTAPGGTAVTSGTTAKGAWTLLGATSRRCWFWQLGVQVNVADAAHIAGVYHLDLAEGDGTNFSKLLANVAFATATNESACLPPITAGAEAPVPEGRNIYARAQCSGTPNPLFITAYGAGG